MFRNPEGSPALMRMSTGSACPEYLPGKLFCSIQVFRSGPAPVKYQESATAMIISQDRAPFLVKVSSIAAIIFFAPASSSPDRADWADEELKDQINESH